MLFSEVIGQESTKKQLIGYVRQNRISHSLMFLGPEGSGNLALAIAYAQYISCTDKEEDDSCGKCASCTKYAKLIHPDLHFVFPTAPSTGDDEKSEKKIGSDAYIPEWRKAILADPYFNLYDWMIKIGVEGKQLLIGVSESASIIHKLNLKSYESAYKIMIIWQPEKMNSETANKLLKILEEPPENTLFFLVSENQSRILPTIISRTQLVKVRKIGSNDMLDIITSRFNVNEQEAKRYVYLADGNFNRLQHLIQNDEADLFDNWINWMRYNYAKKIEEITKWVDKIGSENREYQKNYLLFSINMIRESFILGFTDKLSRFSEKDATEMKRFAKVINQSNGALIMDELNQAYYHIERNVNSKIVLLDLSLKIGNLLNPR